MINKQQPKAGQFGVKTVTGGFFNIKEEEEYAYKDSNAGGQSSNATGEKQSQNSTRSDKNNNNN